jgi:ABC-2 type transport system ATP-binding protein
MTEIHAVPSHFAVNLNKSQNRMQSAEDQMNPLEVEDVVKDFTFPLTRRKVRALDGISLVLKPGQIIGLVGPNGSGKTTALRIFAGLLKPNQGRIRLFGSLAGSRPARLVTGYMPEQPGLPGTLTPREMLSFISRIFNLDRNNARVRIQELETLLSMSDYMDRRLSRLSKGMSKRVGLAAALMNHPRILLLDEPLEGLDPLGTTEVKEHLKTLASQDVGILISSHILSDVEAICSHILFLHEGKIILQGERDRILAQRDRMEIRFCAPEGDSLLQTLCERIEAEGGKVESAGHPRQQLEDLFKKVVGERDSSAPGAQP